MFTHANNTVFRIKSVQTYSEPPEEMFVKRGFCDLFILFLTYFGSWGWPSSKVPLHRCLLLATRLGNKN